MRLRFLPSIVSIVSIVSVARMIAACSSASPSAIAEGAGIPVPPDPNGAGAGGPSSSSSDPDPRTPDAAAKDGGDASAPVTNVAGTLDPSFASGGKFVLSEPQLTSSNGSTFFLVGNDIVFSASSSSGSRARSRCPRWCNPDCSSRTESRSSRGRRWRRPRSLGSTRRSRWTAR